jgi:anti-sigma factor RsiW
MFYCSVAVGHEGQARTRFETLLLLLMSDDGYSVSHWDRDGFELWAVSDVNAEDLRAFAGLEMQPS